MARKGLFEAFMAGWAEVSKPARQPTRPTKPVKPDRSSKLRPEPKYQWIKEAKYRGQDTSLEPKPYAGVWRWLAKRIK